MKFYYLILLFLFICSCQTRTQGRTEILQKALNIPQAKKYFHPELNSRNPYYLVKNKFVNTNDKLSMYGVPMIIKKKSDINTKNYIEVTKIKKGEDQIKVWYFYKKQNASFLAILNKTHNSWKLFDYDIIIE